MKSIFRTFHWDAGLLFLFYLISFFGSGFILSLSRVVFEGVFWVYFLALTFACSNLLFFYWVLVSKCDEDFTRWDIFVNQIISFGFCIPFCIFMIWGVALIRVFMQIPWVEWVAAFHTIGVFVGFCIFAIGFIWINFLMELINEKVKK